MNRPLFRSILVLALALAPLIAAGDARAQFGTGGIMQLPDTEFLEFVKQGKTEEVNRALIRGQSPNTSDSSGRTAMMYAAATGNVEIIEMLAKNKANVRLKDKQGNSALSWAATSGHEEAVDALVQIGAVINDPDRQGTTPLMMAARRGFDGVVRLLLAAKADVNATDHTGRTAMMWAKDSRNPQVQKLLQAAGAR